MTGSKIHTTTLPANGALRADPAKGFMEFEAGYFVPSGLFGTQAFTRTQKQGKTWVTSDCRLRFNGNRATIVGAASAPITGALDPFPNSLKLILEDRADQLRAAVKTLTDPDVSLAKAALFPRAADALPQLAIERRSLIERALQRSSIDRPSNLRAIKNFLKSTGTEDTVPQDVTLPEETDNQEPETHPTLLELINALATLPRPRDTSISVELNLEDAKLSITMLLETPLANAPKCWSVRQEVPWLQPTAGPYGSAMATMEVLAQCETLRALQLALLLWPTDVWTLYASYHCQTGDGEPVLLFEDQLDAGTDLLGFFQRASPKKPAQVG